MEYGDVIRYEDKTYVNLGIIKNNEDAGSCSYDRIYRLFPVTENDEKITGTHEDLRDVHVRAMNLPFKKTDWIPYNVYEQQTRLIRNESLIAEQYEYTLERKKPTVVYQ